MIHYPLLATSDGKKTRIRTEKELLARFDQVFDSGVKCAIQAASANDVWGNWQGFMVGDGAVWFDAVIPPNEKPDAKALDAASYPFKIKTVNHDGQRGCKSTAK